MKKTYITIMTALVAAFTTMQPSTVKAGLFDSSREEFKVKGLYLGMPIQESSAVLKNVLKTSKRYAVAAEGNILDVKTQDNGKQSISMMSQLGIPLIIIGANQDGKVNLILMESYVINDLFNASDMSGEEFAKAFIDAYHIPELKPSGNNWTYTSESGVKLTITTEKGVAIEEVPSAKERTSSFN